MSLVDAYNRWVQGPEHADNLSKNSRPMDGTATRRSDLDSLWQRRISNIDMMWNTEKKLRECYLNRVTKLEY